MTVRIAAIGVSHWHALYDAAYLRQLARMPDVELIAVQDADPTIAAHRASQCGNMPAFRDYPTMLRDTRPDFVLALGRHSEMASIAHHLLDHGLPFIMEKPMGLDAAEVRSIAVKADAKGLFAAVPMPLRYTPFAEQARFMLRAGAFGPLSHIYVRTNRFSSDRYADWGAPWMLDPDQSNGGCLRNLGMHGLDLFLMLTGEAASVRGAQISFRAHQRRVEDYASVLLNSETGVCGTIEVGNTYPRRTVEGNVAESGRDKLLDGADGEWKICGRDAMLMAKDGVLRTVTSENEVETSGLATEHPAYSGLQHAIGNWKAGLRPPVDAWDCYHAVKLADDAYAMAARTNASGRGAGVPIASNADVHGAQRVT